jgi:uncharacterized damage-inducible protein DinB
MEILHTDAFLSYLERTRMATLRVIEVIPPDKLDWAYMPGKFTIGDMVRHIAAIERHVFAEVALGNKPNYKGCRKDLADGYDNVVSYFNEMHAQSVEIFKSLSDEALRRKMRSLDGKEIELGNFLRALLLHEIHHRGALCIYLNLLGVTTPPIIGLMEEQVIELSK